MKSLIGYGKDLRSGFREVSAVLAKPLELTLKEVADIAVSKRREKHRKGYERTLRHESGHAFIAALEASEGAIIQHYKVGRLRGETYGYLTNLSSNIQKELLRLSSYWEKMTGESVNIFKGISTMVPEVHGSGNVFQSMPDTEDTDMYHKHRILLGLGGPVAEAQVDRQRALNKLTDFVHGERNDGDFSMPYWSVNHLMMERGHDLSDRRISNIVRRVFFAMESVIREQPFSGALETVEKHLTETHDSVHLRQIGLEALYEVATLLQGPLQVMSPYPENYMDHIEVNLHAECFANHEALIQRLSTEGYDSDRLKGLREELHEEIEIKLIDGMVPSPYDS